MFRSRLYEPDSLAAVERPDFLFVVKRGPVRRTLMQFEIYARIMWHVKMLLQAQRWTRDHSARAGKWWCSRHSVSKCRLIQTRWCFRDVCCTRTGHAGDQEAGRPA